MSGKRAARRCAEALSRKKLRYDNKKGSIFGVFFVGVDVYEGIGDVCVRARQPLGSSEPTRGPEAKRAQFSARHGDLDHQQPCRCARDHDRRNASI